MNWFTKVEARVQRTEAEIALEAVRLTGEAHVASIVKAAEVAGKKLLADALAKVEAEQVVVINRLVAQARAVAQSAVASATAAATPAGT